MDILKAFNSHQRLSSMPKSQNKWIYNTVQQLRRKPSQPAIEGDTPLKHQTSHSSLNKKQITASKVDSATKGKR